MGLTLAGQLEYGLHRWYPALIGKGSALFRTKSVFWVWTVAIGALLAPINTGCVTRKYTIDSQPQGALVYRDGKPIGTTPVDDSIVFYGNYRFSLVKDGYETLHVEQKIPAPWYEYIPLDFIAENLVPWEINDVHRFSYTLQPQQMPNNNDILQKASDLRKRGKGLVPLHAPETPITPVATPAPGTTIGAITPTTTPSTGSARSIQPITLVNPNPIAGGVTPRP